MMSGTLPRLGIVVLAAGFSERLGSPKALATVGGQSLLRRTLRVLAPFRAGAPIRVVVPPRAARYRIGVARTALFIANPRRCTGLASSVVLGLQRTRHCAAVLLLPVDLARLRHRDVARLVLRWQGARRRLVAHRIVAERADVPGTLGAVAGTPLILPRRLMPRALRTAGDRGLRDWLRRLPKSDATWVDMPSADLDVDTPMQLAQARRRQAGA